MIVWEGSSGRLSTLDFGTALLLTLPGVGSFLPGPNRGGLWNPPSLQVGLTTFGSISEKINVGENLAHKKTNRYTYSIKK